MTNATVKPIGRDHIRIAPEPGYEVVVFKCSDGSAEAIVLDRNFTEATRLRIEKPRDGQTLIVLRHPFGAWEVQYDPPTPMPRLAPLAQSEAALCRVCGIHPTGECENCGERK